MEHGMCTYSLCKSWVLTSVCMNKTQRVLKTTGHLVDWQDTYGRLEIWEIDDNGVKWQHISYEFNWWNDTCFFIDGNALMDRGKKRYYDGC